MTDHAALHARQLAEWNGESGRRWATEQVRTDRAMAAIAAVLLERAAPRPGEAVIDVGCGGGITTALIADAVGSAGRVLALDVSAPLLEGARRRLAGRPNVAFLLGDAAALPLEGTGADLLASRFGVMFFGDPVAGFANLRRGLRPGGRTVFACWRRPSENPWMTLPLHAAYRHVPRLPEQAPTDPGPFAFADPDHVRAVLVGAGFVDASLEPVDLAMDLGADLDEALAFLLEIGPTSRALEGHSEANRHAVAASIREVLAPYVSAAGVRVPAAIWIVRATAP